MTRITKNLLSIALAMGIWFGTAQAQFKYAPAAGPVDITGESFESVDGRDYVVWTGDVQLVQGARFLNAEKLVIHGVNDGRIARLEAFGGVRFTDGEDAISGEMAVYDDAKKVFVFTGGVVSVQGGNVMTGDKLVYHVETGALHFTSQPDTRVRGIFFTKEESAKS